MRSLESITVWSRNAEHRERFAQELTKELGIPAEPASAPEAAARGQDVIITITTARIPCCWASGWSQAFTSTPAGSNSLLRR